MTERKDDKSFTLSEVKDAKPLTSSEVQDAKPLTLSEVQDAKPLTSSEVQDDKSFTLPEVQDAKPLTSSEVQDAMPLTSSEVQDDKSFTLPEVQDAKPLPNKRKNPWASFPEKKSNVTVTATGKFSYCEGVDDKSINIGYPEFSSNEDTRMIAYTNLAIHQHTTPELPHFHEAFAVASSLYKTNPDAYSVTAVCIMNLTASDDDPGAWKIDTRGPRILAKEIYVYHVSHLKLTDCTGKDTVLIPIEAKDGL